MAEIRPAGKIGSIYLHEIGDYTPETRYPVKENVVARMPLLYTGIQVMQS